MRPTRACAFALLALAAAAGCDDARPRVAAEPPPGQPAPRETGLLAPAARLLPDGIDESSGLAWVGGAFFTLNDSGNEPVLWRSAQLDFGDAEPLRVPGVGNLDWESLAAVGDDLLVCDIGDNLRMRPEVAVHRVRHVPAERRLEVVESYRLAYPDGRHDAEAAAVVDGVLHVITKDRGEGTQVYRFAVLRPGERLVGEHAATLDLGEKEQVTGADYDPESRSLVLLTYTQLARYPADAIRGAPADSTTIFARQCEALAVRGDALVLTNEQREVFEIPDFRAWRHAALLPAVPEVRAARVARIEEVGDPDAHPDATPAGPARLVVATAPDRVLVRVRADVRGELEEFDLAAGRLGSAVLLGLGTESRRHVSGEETLVAIARGPGGRWEALGLGLASERPVLVPLPAVPVTSSETLLERGAVRLSLAAEIPASVAFRTPAVPRTVRLFALTRRLARPGASDGALGALDPAALYRPYLWPQVDFDF